MTPSVLSSRSRRMIRALMNWLLGCGVYSKTASAALFSVAHLVRARATTHVELPQPYATATSVDCGSCNSIRHTNMRILSKDMCPIREGRFASDPSTLYKCVERPTVMLGGCTYLLLMS